MKTCGTSLAALESSDDGSHRAVSSKIKMHIARSAKGTARGRRRRSGRVGEAKRWQAVEPMSTQPHVQLRPRETQASRRLRLVAVCLLQHLQDLLTLNRTQIGTWIR